MLYPENSEQRKLLMKSEIHPKYGRSEVTCACGNTWETGSVQESIRVDICDKCHPFYTGQQRIVDTLGRVERLRKRYAKKED